ncbi:MAG: nucleotidyltransferase domain-containing protein, partial [Planctomycetota bacterium]|nr:nucleotidyltransferase domain-containing protein [Planctomycetota bacterium]
MMDPELVTHAAEVEKRRRIARQAAEIYRNFETVTSVFAWGSTALGDADPGSDVDVGVYFAGEIPAEAQRKKALEHFADDLSAVSFGKFADLAGSEGFSVEGVHVFVAWWSFDDDKRRMQAKLH